MNSDFTQEVYDLKKMMMEIEKNKAVEDQDWMHFSGPCPFCGMTSTTVYDQD